MNSNDLSTPLLEFKQANPKLGHRALINKFNKEFQASITEQYLKKVIAGAKKKKQEVKKNTYLQSELDDLQMKVRTLQYSNEELRKQVRYLDKQSNLQDRLLATCETHILSLPPKKYKVCQVQPKKKKLGCELVLLISDTHIGEVVNKDEMVGLGEYNINVFRKRFQFLIDKVAQIKIDILNNAYDIKKLNILFLGDIVCLTGDSNIILENGRVREMRDIQVGDKLIGRFGVDEVDKVIITQGTHWINKIRSIGVLDHTQATDEHVFPIIDNSDVPKTMYNGKENGRKKKFLSVDNIKLKKTKDIKVGDYMLRKGYRIFSESNIIDLEEFTKIKLISKGNEWIENVRGNKPIVKDKFLSITEDLLYAVGIYLAKGNPIMCKNKEIEKAAGITFTFNIKEANLAKNLIKKLNNCFGQEYTRITEKEHPDNNTRVVNVYNKIIATFFIEATGRGAHSKYIHNKIYNFKGSLLPLIGGWLDGDGSASSINSIFGTTVSRDVTYQIENACLFEGINAASMGDYKSYRIYFAGKYANAIKKYTFRFSQLCFKNGYEEGVWIGSFYASRVRSIERYETTEPVYDIKMKNDPYFQVNGIISHNCGNIHQELIETAHDTVIEWTFNGSRFVAPYIAELATLFPQIDICGVVGNHGRLNQKPNFKRKYVNWDTVFYKSLELQLKSIPNIKCQFGTGLFQVKEICGFNFLMMHGDGIPSSLGIPFYGINRVDANLTGSMTAQNQQYHYLCLGHFHTASTLDRWQGEKIINGSMIGGNEFSLGKMSVVSEPKQLLFVTFPKHGKGAEFKLNLKYAEKIQDIRYSYNN